MKRKRIALLAALLVPTESTSAQAGCLDWLFGGSKTPAFTTAPVVPYSAGFAPTTVAPASAPLVFAPGAFAASPSVSNPYVSNFPVWGAPTVQTFPSVQPSMAAQAPPYVRPIDNPSVLTGRPVMPPGTMPSAVSFNSAAAFSAPVNGPGITTAPMFPPAAMTQPSAPSTFFGKVFGNRYQTSYFNAPTTVYRPVTQVDPATGALVTVQQPCTTNTQQVLRSPYASLQPAPAMTPPQGYIEPGCGGEMPINLPPTSYVPQPTLPSSAYSPGHSASVYGSGVNPYGGAYGQPGSAAMGQAGVSQATAIAPITGYHGVPPQSYAPQSYAPQSYAPQSYAPQGAAANTAPLTGYPSIGYPNGSTGDAAPVEQPRLESGKSPYSDNLYPNTSYPTTPQSTTPQSNTPYSNPSPDPYGSWSAPASPPGGSALQAPPLLGDNQASAQYESRYSDIPPIPAADSYQPPAWTPSKTTPNLQPVNSERPSDARSPVPSPPSPFDRTTHQLNGRPAHDNDSALRYASAHAPHGAGAAGATTRAIPQPWDQPQSGVPSQRSLSPGAPEQRRDDSGWFAIGN